MEELLSYNWNVYKLFSNGNRAKAPFAVVEGEDCESESFMSKVRKNLEEKFGAKAALTKYKIMRADLGLDLQNKRTTGALVMSKDTNWKWQWCVLRMSSNQFIAALSPEFDSAENAQDWMKSEIELITK
jgi:hypothetical protein